MEYLIVFGVCLVVVFGLVLAEYIAAQHSSKELSSAIKRDVHVPAPAPHNCLVTERGPGPLPVRPSGDLYIVALSDGASSAANSIGAQDMPAALRAAVDVLTASASAQLHVVPTFDLRLLNLASSREKRASIPESLRARIKGVQF